MVGCNWLERTNGEQNCPLRVATEFEPTVAMYLWWKRPVAVVLARQQTTSSLRALLMHAIWNAKQTCEHLTVGIK